MSNALLSGVSGLKVNQKMIDVTGNNLANVNTNGFKASRIQFADLLATTIREAAGPSEGLGGTNPAQIGSGVQVATIDRNMGQGNLIHRFPHLRQDLGIGADIIKELPDGAYVLL